MPASMSKSLSQVEAVNAMGMLISSAEWVAIRPVTEPGAVLDWEVSRTRMPLLRGRLGRALTPVFKGKGFVALQAVRSGACLCLLTSGRPRLRGMADLALSGTNYLLSLRGSYGADGSEQMGMIAGLMSTIARNSTNRDVQRWSMYFLAAQSSLSYFAAGVAKLVSPVWRNGDAVRDVLRTRCYGHEAAYRFMCEYPQLSKLASWGTIAFETGFPLVFVVSKNKRRVLLATALSFHLANGALMGLNRFVWSFSATYPAIDFVACQLHGSEAA